jgi:UDP-glucose 4-epimerase
MAERVVVTGGAGFIGSHSVEGLLGEGASVLVIDDMSHASTRPLPATCAVLVADIAGEEARRVIAAFKPTAILHLAAQGGVNRSWREPLVDARINVLGTVSVLRVARDTGCRVVLASSGGAVYGAAEHLPAVEDTQPAPRSPYGTAKLATETYLAMFARSGGPGGMALRYSNVYGPGQDGTGEAGVVAITCTRLLSGLPPRLRGDGSQTRDFVYVADVVAANLAALHSATDGVLNTGTGVETAVREVIERISAVAGYRGETEVVPLPAGEVSRSRLDVRSARTVLGWEPRVALDDGLARTFEYFRDALPAQPSGKP